MEQRLYQRLEKIRVENPVLSNRTLHTDIQNQNQTVREIFCHATKISVVYGAYEKKLNEIQRITRSKVEVTSFLNFET